MVEHTPTPSHEAASQDEPRQHTTVEPDATEQPTRHASADEFAPVADEDAGTEGTGTGAEEMAAEPALAEPAAPVNPFGLLFQAPDLAALPPLPALPRDDDARGGDDDHDEEEGSVGSRSRRSRSRSARRRDREGEPQVVAEPQRVKGSTRLEAKRQRRREGRDAGRRRTVVTETEFMARREAVDREMIVRSRADRVQLAVLEDGVLVEHYVAKESESSLIGNVYLGRVQNILPSMEAAFVDIGRGRNAVLYSGEVDWDAADLQGQPRKIEHALKAGDTVLVQVTKDPVGHKGARLTSQISLPGRYLVSVPGGSMSGISRKLPDTERARLKSILKQVLP